MNTLQYRCVANNACRTLYSNKAVLTVSGGGAIPTLAIAPALNGMCVGMPGSFNVKVTNGGAAPGYKWIVNGNDAGSSSANYTNPALQNGDKVSVVMESNGGCGASKISSNIIEVKMGTTPEVKTNTEIKIFEGFSAKLTATSPDQVTYSWAPTTGVTSGASTANPVVKPAKTTIYKVTASNTSGCAATADVTVTVVKRIAMPRMLTPNGDGQNDLFVIPAVDPAYTLQSMSIADATGKVIWQTTDITKGWDGTVKGAKVANGIYSYSIIGILQSGKSTVKGTFLLKR
jgi:gliding motility-associated-like protein